MEGHSILRQYAGKMNVGRWSYVHVVDTQHFGASGERNDVQE